MKKVSTRKTSVVWVNENSQLKVLPILQSIVNENEQYFWSHPEEMLFVHDNANCVRDGHSYVLHLEDQDITIADSKVFRFRGDIETAIANSLIASDQYVQKIQPLDADVSVILACASTDPENMSWFFNMEFVMSPDYDDKCPACVLHLDQANKIVEFLNEAVFICKNLNVAETNFLQKNMKRAIFISDTSKGSILRWFVDTFRITFERAKIQRVVLHDLETDDQYIAEVNVS